MTTVNVLVLGGAGMIGRNFVKYLVDHDVVAAVRVADKTMPEIAYFRCESNAFLTSYSGSSLSLTLFTYVW